MTSPDPDRYVKAVYAKRAIRDKDIKSWERLSDHARDYWRDLVGDMIAVLEELRAEEVRG